MIMFASLLFSKGFHWLCQDRVEFIETTPNTHALTHCRIVAFMATLFFMDVQVQHPKP